MNTSKSVCSFLLFLATFVSFYPSATAAQPFKPTHEVIIGGQLSFKNFSSQVLDGKRSLSVCTGKTDCTVQMETSEKEIVNFAGQLYQIKKDRKRFGKPVYSKLTKNRIKWEVVKNEIASGDIHITFLRENKDGTQVYREELDLPNNQGWSETIFKDGVILSQQGTINKKAFVVNRLRITN